MKTLKKISALSLLSLSLVASNAFADDISKIIKSLESIAESSTNMESLQSDFLPSLDDINTYTKASAEDVATQLGLSKDEWTALTKAYDMGSHTNTPNALSFESNTRYTELWSSDNWEDALKTVSSGNNSRYSELKAAYAATNPTLLDDSQTVDGKKLVSSSYTQKANTVNTALAGSQYTYENINQRIRNIQDLENMIDDTSKNANEKAAIDLNSRLVAETALIQLEALKQASMQVQMQAADIQSDVNHETIEKQGSTMINH